MRYIFIILILLHASLSGEARWKLQPKFTTRPIEAIQFISPTIGWITTVDELFYSTDGGFTWENKRIVLDTFSTFSIAKICFLTASNGWLLQKQGTILYKTVNGGTSWTKSPIPADIIVDDMFFLDTTRGWTCGRIYSGSFSSVVIARTTDGGASWDSTRASIPTGNQFSDILFTDTLNGWAAGSENRRIGVTDMYHSISTIFKTCDGGITWEQVYTGNHESVEGLSPNLYSVQFSDKQHGWAVGTDVFDTDYLFAKPTIVYTTDGGSTWTDTMIFPGTEPNAYSNCRSIHFINSTEGYLTASKGVSDSSVVMHTTNGGISWQRQLTVPGRIIVSEMPDASHGWMGGENGLLYILTDETVSSTHSRQAIGRPPYSGVPASTAGYLLNGKKVRPGLINSFCSKLTKTA